MGSKAGKNKMSSCWRCPANIALIKYWGKKDFQQPLNPSLSFVLNNAFTETSVSLTKEGDKKVVFYFEGQESPFVGRIEKYLDHLRAVMPWIENYRFIIKSRNSFPHSAGIASSASAFGALALCLAELDFSMKGLDRTHKDFFQVASDLARRGSGSASRSIFPGFSIWGQTQLFSGCNDDYAIPISDGIHPVFNTIRDAVLLVDSSSKEVSSSAGHQLMNDHLFQRSRIAQAHENLNSLYLSLLTGDQQKFLEIAESEALSLHAMMMTSNPSFLLLKPNSLEIIHRIRKFRQTKKIPVGFTIDAGPNIHLLYFEANRTDVLAFIKHELLPFCEERKWMDDKLGQGPERISEF